MVRSLTLIPALLCAVALVSAQAPTDRPSPPAAPPAAQQPSNPAAQPATPATPAAAKVTYSGCVKPGTLPDTFVLESAELAPAAGAATQGSAVGTSGMKTTLNLTTKAGTDLKPHANHKIEVIGTLAPPKAPAPGASASATTKPAQEFNVESIRMVSATCS